MNIKALNLRRLRQTLRVSVLEMWVKECKTCICYDREWPDKVDPISIDWGPIIKRQRLPSQPDALDWPGLAYSDCSGAAHASLQTGQHHRRAGP